MQEDLVEDDPCLGHGVSASLAGLVDLLNDILDNVVGIFLGAEESLEEGLCPHDAVDYLLRLLPYRAHGETLVLGPLDALIARRYSLHDGNALNMS